MPGTVVSVEKDSFCVQTGDGVLRVLEVQMPGKKRMDTGAFLRGYALEEGSVFGRESMYLPKITVVTTKARWLMPKMIATSIVEEVKHSIGLTWRKKATKPCLTTPISRKNLPD